MLLPEGAAQLRRTDNTLVKAMARAFRQKRMLESGEFATIAELAGREGIAPSYLTRVLRLTLLAPDIVEAILHGEQGPEVTLARVLREYPLAWEQQRRALAQASYPPIAGTRAHQSELRPIEERSSSKRHFTPT